MFQMSAFISPIQATKILFGSTHSTATAVANGVQFAVGSSVYNVTVAREVIVSAGTVQSPALLEHSGSSFFLLGRVDLLTRSFQASAMRQYCDASGFR
jgi:choline dehydrogenase-like flavoprotein